MLGGLLIIAALTLLAYEAVKLIMIYQGVVMPVLHPWISIIGVSAGPPLLIAMSLFAWGRARRWRRMDEMRDDVWDDPATNLARGEYRAVAPERGPGFLERVCLWLALLGLCAVPYWFGMPNPVYLAGGAILIVWIARALFRSGCR